MKSQSPIAVAVIVEENRKILLVKEAKPPAQGKWNQPAGRLEPNESIKEGALREVKEETGFDVELTGLVGIYDELSKPKQRLRFIFKAKLKDLKQEEYSEDISKVKWFSKDVLNKLSEKDFASEVTYQSIKDYLSGKYYPLTQIT